MFNASELVRVDRLAVTFLVDNSLEWMTKLPPGFKHEVNQHLMHDPPIDPLTHVPIMDLENFCCGAHGFSALIETWAGDAKRTILFDTGPDSASLVRNLDALKIPVDVVERVVLSHWHADHSGGLLAFIAHRAKALAQARPGIGPRPAVVVDLHPDRPIARGIAPPTMGGRILCRLPEDPTFEQITQAGGKVERHREGHYVAGGTVFRWVEEDGKGIWVDDTQIIDERYAVVDVLGKGLLIFSACSHAGIVNVVRDAVDRFKRPVYMVIGGMHLAGPELGDRIAPTVQFLAEDLRPAPTYVLPMHCTGFAAKVALQAALGDGCVPAGTGHKFEVDGDRAFDARLPVPSVPPIPPIPVLAHDVQE